VQRRCRLLFVYPLDGIVPQLPYTHLVKMPSQNSLLMCLVPRISKIRTKDVRNSLQDQDVRRRRAKDQRCPPEDEDLKRRVSKTKDVKDNNVVLLIGPVRTKNTATVNLHAVMSGLRVRTADNHRTYVFCMCQCSVVAL
jgi:hypothetical protein